MREGSKRTAAFIDKDGTLIEDIPFNVDPRRIRLEPRAAEGLIRLHRSGHLIVVVTNQPGVALGHFPEEALDDVEERLRALLGEHDVPLAGFYHCPHDPRGTVSKYAVPCGCRKPRPGMLESAAAELGIDLRRSWILGDILDDVEAGHRASARAVLVDRGNETEWRISEIRTPEAIAGDLDEAAGFIIGSAPPEPVETGREHRVASVVAP